MDNKENKNECMWMLMGSIHESNRVTVAKCLDMMEEKDISKEEMISNIESAKEELFTLYNEKINIIIMAICHVKMLPIFPVVEQRHAVMVA